MNGDWMAALGVTVRVPHLSWVSMNGQAKRDYPASFNYQIPWYKEYSYVEDHFARVNTAMTRGKPVVKVGVIHPVESFWLHWGPNDKSAIFRDGTDENFIVQIEPHFNYIQDDEDEEDDDDKITEARYYLYDTDSKVIISRISKREMGLWKRKPLIYRPR